MLSRSTLALTAAWTFFVATAVALVMVATSPYHLLVLIPDTLLVVCGSIIVTRTDVPRIGWLLLLPGAGFNLLYVADTSPGGELTTLASWVYPASLPLILAFALLILTFPTGRLASPAARVVAWAGAIGLGIVMTADIGRALGLVEISFEVTFRAMTALFAAVTVAGLVIHARLYRQRPRVEQLQIKWFLLAIAGQLLYPAMEVLGASDDAFLVLDSLATSLWPITILIAIMRFRLYEIDRLLSRTVAYVLVIGVLAATGAGMLLLLTSLLPSQDRFVVAVTTVGVVASFDPLRHRLVDAVDRRFNRTRYVAQRVVEAFGRAVQEETDADAVQRRVQTVVEQTLAPTSVAVWQPVPKEAL